MVRTYWLVQVFNEASWNLGLQPDRTDDQVESNSAPCYVNVNGTREPSAPGALPRGAGEIGRSHVLVTVLAGGLLELGADRLQHRQLQVVALHRLQHQPGVLGRELELERRLEAPLDHHPALHLGVGVVDRASRDRLQELRRVDVDALGEGDRLGKPLDQRQ